MAFCWVRNCENFKQLNPNVTLYPVPDRLGEKVVWSKAFGIPIEHMNKFTQICSNHFVHKNKFKHLYPTEAVDPSLKMNGEILYRKALNTEEVCNSSASSPVISLPKENNLKTDSNSNLNYFETNYVSKMRNLLACDLYLDCQEEDLSQIQQNFHTQEWLNYCKYSASINDLSSVRTANGSEIETYLPSNVSSSSDLPVLVFSNAPPVPQNQIPQAVFFPVVNNTNTAPSNASYLLQVPPTVSSNSMLNVSNSEYLQSNINVQPAMNLQPSTNVQPTLNVQSAVNAKSVAIQPAINVQSSVFPVKLVTASEKPSLSIPDEGVFPLILQDSLSELLQNPLKDAILSSEKLLSVSAVENVSEPLSNVVEGSLTSSISDDQGNNECMSPDLLKNFEVNFHESESNSYPVSSSVKDVSQFLPSDEASNDSSGLKILNIVSGVAGAQEYFKDESEKLEQLDVNVKSDEEKSTIVFPYETLTTEKTMPKTVTQWSIFSMQKTIAVISSGSLEASILNLLNLRAFMPPPFFDRDGGTNLKDFLTSTPRWLIKNKFLPLNSKCNSCGSQIFEINSFSSYSDNLCWKCLECSKITPVKRLKFFERFPMLSLEELLLLTYHWAVKSRPHVIKRDVSVNDEVIFKYYTALQEICGEYVSKYCKLGNTPSNSTTVEVSAVKFGKYFIMCAFCRRSKLTRMKALTTDEACCTIAHIKELEKMLGQKCNLITWKKIHDSFLPDVAKYCADSTVTSVHSAGRHILNASKYLGKTLIELFQKICHDQLSIKVIQGYLDEVQWRERFAQSELSAFWNIMKEISRMNETHNSEALCGILDKNRYFYKQDFAFKIRWGPFVTSIPVVKNPISSSCSGPSSSISNVQNTSVCSDSSSLSTIAPSPSSEIKTAKIVPQCNTSPTSNIQKNSAPVSPSKVTNPREIVALKTRHPISLSLQNPLTKLNEKMANDKTFSGKPGSIGLLSIKVSFHEDKSLQVLFQNQALKLGEKLKSELFLQKPVKWLVEKKLINNISSCYVCQSTARLVENSKYPDGVSWLCQKDECKFENRFKRPNFFAHFGFPLDVIFCVIYHWAVQSSYSIAIRSIPLNEFNIISVHRRLQQICSEIAKRPSCRVGGRRRLVEVALVKFANCFILGAMERETKLSRLRVFSIHSRLHIDEIRKTLMSWLHADSTVIVNSNKYFGAYSMEEKINLVFAERDVRDVTSRKYHTLTISNYLQNQMKNMFASVKVEYLSADLLQIYLDELVWRERYGRSPLVAFKNIMQDIFLSEYQVHDKVPFGLCIQNGASTGFMTLPEVKVVLEKLPDHIIEKYCSSVSDTAMINEVEIVESMVQSASDEVIISDNEASTSKSDKSVPSSTALNVLKVSVNNTLDDMLPDITEIELPSISPEENNLILRIRQEEGKRYSDKCYSHRRRVVLNNDSKFKCIECKELVSINHFLKKYSCDDCKYSVYTTFCPRAFAEHRSYVLFGRKKSYSKRLYANIQMQDWWYCSCGFASREGNEMACHLVKCQKTTCYSSYQSIFEEMQY